MVDFDNHEHNDRISIKVRVDEVLQSDGDKRVYDFIVTTTDSKSLTLSIWDGSPAVNVDWERGNWYQMKNVLLKKWASEIELNGTNNTTAEHINPPNTRKSDTIQHTNFTSNTDTAILHVGPANYASSNITTDRREEFHQAFEATIDIAVQRDVDAIVLTGQLFATQSPTNENVIALRESLNELRDANIPLLLAGSPRDYEFELVDELAEDGLLKMLSGSPEVIGDLAIYGTSPVEKKDVITEMRSVEPIPPEAESAIVAVSGTISPPEPGAKVTVDKLLSASPVPIETILAGNRKHRESHAPVDVSGCQLFQAGPIEFLLRKWVTKHPPEYPCTVRIIRSSTTEEVPIPHRPFVLYRVESPSTDQLPILKEVIEAESRTVLVELTGPKGPEPLSKQALEEWLREQTTVSKVWDDRSKATVDRPLNVESPTSEPSVELPEQQIAETESGSTATESDVSESISSTSGETEANMTTNARLYLTPCDNPVLNRYFEKTVLSGIPENSHNEFTTDEMSGALHFWGVPEQKVNRYAEMDAGDFMLFYTGEGKYEYAAQIIRTEQNPALIENLERIFESNNMDVKGLDRWEYCIYLEQPFQIDIESNRIHDYAGHTVNKPFNILRLNQKGRESIRQEYGSIKRYLQSHRIKDSSQAVSTTDNEIDSTEELVDLLSRQTGSTTTAIGRDVSKLDKRDIPLTTIQQTVQEKHGSNSNSILSVDGVGIVRAARLHKAGYDTIPSLANTPVSELADIYGISTTAARVMKDHGEELQSGENIAREIASQSGCEVESVEKTLGVVAATGVPRSEAKPIVSDLHADLSLFDIDGLQRRAAYHLVDHGYKTPEEIAAADATELVEVPQIGEGNVDTIQQNAAEFAASSGDESTSDSRNRPADNSAENDAASPELSSDTPPDIEQLAAISGLDRGHIRDTVRQLELTGCSSDEAREHYCQYLVDMLRGQGVFALSGVGPLSGRELIQFGITEGESLTTADSQLLANETQLSVDQISEIQETARNEEYDSMEAANSELAKQLINKYSTERSESKSDSKKEATQEATSDSKKGVTRESKPDSKQRITQEQARKLLEQSAGQKAEFRPQQWEAIDKLANDRDQLLLVQRTGWGKSTVYFIATKAIREDGGGPTLIISPLLSLMRDQIKNAEEELGLSALTINSRNEGEWENIYDEILNGDCDIVLISPERLRNQEFRDQVLTEMDDGFGMLVVDEAHCISDWGHDFRPDYQRVTRILDRLPSNVPVAATTATANDRVVDDITTQLPGLEPIRGDLVRDSLKIQAINMGDREKRLAWLAENLPEGDRAGIVYCLTKDDIRRVAEWLSQHGYDVKAYHGGLDTKKRQEREQMLLENEVDALVATNALGMGFDKPDLKYVIHFQRPQNLIRYYQEIGRAGRDLDTAHAVVLSGPDDDDTAEYFIDSSFPNANNFAGVLATIEAAADPLSKWDVRKNSDASQVSRCLQMLEVDGAIERTGDGYVRTANQWEYRADKFEKITEQRYAELERIQTFMETNRCLTLFIDEQLDGQMTEPCGRCANCAGDFYPRTVSNQELIGEAVEHYQNSGIQSISNRVYRYLEDGSRKKIPSENQLETGRSLSVYDEPGWGTLVKEGKYETGRFDNSLVTGAVDVIETEWDPSPSPEWITYMPSESTEGLIADYASRLAAELDLEIIDCVRPVRDTQPQKELSGSAEKCDNVRNAFEITGPIKPGPVLLVDDIVASRWTLTEVGRQLVQAGSGSVYPFALAKRRG